MKLLNVTITIAMTILLTGCHSFGASTSTVCDSVRRLKFTPSEKVLIKQTHCISLENVNVLEDLKNICEGK
jgi:hypothetical protein